MQNIIKKVITIVMTIIITISITSCSKEPVQNHYVSDEVFEYGKIAVEVIDDYLEHNIEADKAIEQLDSLYLRASLVENSVEHLNDPTIKGAITRAGYYISAKENGHASYEDIEHNRDVIQEALYE